MLLSPNLEPIPDGTVLARRSSAWSTFWRLVVVVVLMFMVSQGTVVIAFALMQGDPIAGLVAVILLVPFVLLLLHLRRPRLMHLIVAEPDPSGSMVHPIGTQRVLSTPIPTRAVQHITRMSPPLDMPSGRILWSAFGLAVGLALVAPLVAERVPGLLLLLIIASVPIWVLGFAAPVFGWWSFSSMCSVSQPSKDQGEAMLIAGMLATIPAILINSLLFPLGLESFGIDSEADLGQTLLLTISAPVGEELSKAVAILMLARLITGPARGFQVGFTVGLGFALLENILYISSAAVQGPTAFSFTAVIRGVGSIPGHAVWTALTGASIGAWLQAHPSFRARFGGGSTRALWMLLRSGDPVPIDPIGRSISGRPLPRWIDRSTRRAVPLPVSVVSGLTLAILGHAIWNGTAQALTLFGEDGGLSEAQTNLLTVLVLLGLIGVLMRVMMGLTETVRATAISEADGMEANRPETR